MAFGDDDEIVGEQQQKNVKRTTSSGNNVLIDEKSPLLISSTVTEDPTIIQGLPSINGEISKPSTPPHKPGGFNDTWLLYVSVSLAVLSTLQFGYNTGVISPTMLTIKNIFKFSLTEKSVLVSIVLVGAMIGSMTSGILVDKFGRKYSLLVNNVLYISGPMITTFANNYAMLLVGRIITGLAVGIASTVVPMYISELSPPKTRGALGLLRQSTITFGIMASSLVAYGMLNINNGWRYTFALATVPSFFQIALFFFLLETPRWLISKNRSTEAATVFRRLDSSMSENAIDSQIDRITQSIAEETGHNGWGQLFHIGDILEDAGFSKSHAVLISALVGLPQLFMLLASVWLIDKFGRRPLLIVGLVGMIVGLGVLGYAFYGNGASVDVKSQARGWMAVGGMVFFKLMFSLGLGPIPLIIAAEIFPYKIRGKAMSVTSALNWLANFIINISYPSLLSSIGQAATYWVFAGISFLCLVFVIFVVPETKGVPIEELTSRLVKE
eukprot:gene19509-23371_t